MKPLSIPPSLARKVAAIGIAWYRPEDYAAARAIMLDRDRLPLTYEDWLKNIEQTEREQIAQGRRVIRAIIYPATFPEWCHQHHLQVDAKGRQAFAAHYAARQIGL